MIKTILTKLNVFLVIAGLIFLTGCDLGSSPEPDTPGFGTMEVRMHDAPDDFDEVNVFIERVEVKRQNNGNNGENGENSENGENGGWIVVGEPNQSYNLLELINGKFETLGVTELEAGFYNQIRLIVSREDNNVVIGDETYEMFVPSGEQTGVKLNIHAEIENGSELIVMLDFDAKRSVVKRGQGNAPTPYLLKPVIRASILDNVGNISGTVLPVEARAAVYAISGQDTLSTTYADEETGEFQLVGLEEGFYTVSVDPREDGYIGTEIDDVEVVAGETNDLGEIELDTENGNGENDDNNEDDNDNND